MGNFFSPPTALLSALLAFQDAAAPAAPAHHGFIHFFRHLGLVGLFLVAIVDSSFVPLPIPGVTDIMLILYAAGHTNPILLVAIATIGSAIGGLLSHAAGQAGGMAFLEKHVPKRILGRMTDWMEDHAILSVSLPALLPSADAALALRPRRAGAVHMFAQEIHVGVHHQPLLPPLHRHLDRRPLRPPVPSPLVALL